jgi:lipopolysaccharide transport system ATP-binding protein
MQENRFGSMELQITEVRFVDADGYRCRHIRRGEPLRVEIDYLASRELEAPNFGLVIRQDDNSVLFDGTIASSSIGLDQVKGRGSVALNFDRLDLNTGDYYIDVGVYRHDWAYAYDYHWRGYRLGVLSTSVVKGAVNPPHEWERSVPRVAR